MNPLEHGEVFVTQDGLETDQDLGHYERFLDQSLTKDNYITNGQIYKTVLNKERGLEYDGACVEPYHHIPPEIIKRWKKAGEMNKAEIVIIELGGTVGEYEGLLFFESVRRLKRKNPPDVILIHVGYLPAPPSIGELKSKPLQQSIYFLNSVGLQPDIIVARAEKFVDKRRREKIAFASSLQDEYIIANPDVDSVYKVPLILEKQKIAQKILKKLKMKAKTKDLKEWKNMVRKIDKHRNTLKIGIVGKYQQSGGYTLSDSYVSVVESLKHAGLLLNVKVEIQWINSEDLEKTDKEKISQKLSSLNGIIVPQGWGSRGVEGKMQAVKFARENNIPYLGLCFGMQMAVIEFARNVLNLKNANSQEVNPRTKYPVIHIMPNQKKYLEQNQYGGTIRLGAWPCKIKKGTLLEYSYKKFEKNKKSLWKLDRKNKRISKEKENLIYERHRHRYEFNIKYKNKFERGGLKISGMSPDGKLVEAIELTNHPFFIGTQYHPEYISHPLNPHPIFCAFLEKSLEIKDKKNKN